MRAWPTPIGLTRRDWDALRRDSDAATSSSSSPTPTPTPTWHVALQRRSATRALLVLCAWRDARAPDRVVPVASLVFQDGRVCLVHAEGPAAYFDGTVLDGELDEAELDEAELDTTNETKALEFWASDCARLCGRDVRWTADHATALRFAERVSEDVRLVAAHSPRSPIVIRPKTCVNLGDPRAVRDLARHATRTGHGLVFVRTAASADARGAPHRWDAGATAALFAWSPRPPTVNVVWRRRTDEGPSDSGLSSDLRARMRWHWPLTDPMDPTGPRDPTAAGSSSDSRVLLERDATWARLCDQRRHAAGAAGATDWLFAEPDVAVSKFVDFLNDADDDDDEAREGGPFVVECAITVLHDDAASASDTASASVALRQSDLWDPEFPDAAAAAALPTVGLTPVRLLGPHVRHGDGPRVVLDTIRQALDPVLDFE